MQFIKKFISIFIISIYFLTFSNLVSGGGIGACCYSPTSGIVFESNSNTCLGENQIKIGTPDWTNSDPNLRLCGAFENKGQGCIVGNLCYSSVQGKKIFDIFEVKNSFNFDNYCESYIDIKNPLCKLGGDTQINIGKDSIGGNFGSGGSGSTIDVDSVFNSTRAPSSLTNMCSQSGLPFGFYVTKQSCEAINLSGGNECLFNPYLGGQLNSYYSNYNELGLDYYENSCLPKSEINECYDYKTKDNCNLNPAKNFSSNLIDGCNWVPAKDFTNNIFNKKGGICISKSIDKNKYYDKEKYSFRLNLLKNPSFENGNIGWNFGSNNNNSNIIFDISSYDGDNFYKLKNGNSIEQSIKFVSSNVMYSFFLYARINNKISQNANLQLKMKIFDLDNKLLTEDIISTRESLNKIFNNEIGIFKRVNFNSYKNKNSQNSNYNGVGKITLTLISNGVDLDIDALDFEPYSSNNVVISDNIFKPVEIISYSASKCDLCYDKLKLNLCTKQKSNLLGDCSYMVDNKKDSYTSKLKNYTGTIENIYSNKHPWDSQSLPNSNLFCELYLTKNSCEDKNNYINSKFNSLHSFSGNTLCKWNEQIGCFKDSNNDNVVDIINGLPKLRSMSEIFDNTTLYLTGNYVFKSSNSKIGDSDFALSCDSLSPNSYLYFTGKNLSGNNLIITSKLDSMIGNVNLNMELSDSILESCKFFDIGNKLFVDYKINNKRGFEVYNSNLLNGKFIAKDYFKDLNDESIFVDGKNDISIRVLDQAGNLGKEWNFNLNVDANPPLVELVNLDEKELYKMTLGPSTFFNFSITDYSKITSCKYILTPKSSTVSSTYYQSNGTFDLTNLSKENPYYKFNLPITKSSNNVDFYNLDIICSDLFGQDDVKSLLFGVDFSTDVIVLNPVSFRDYTQNIGFLNSKENFKGISSEYSLNSCNLDFTGYDLITDSKISIFNTPNGFFAKDLFGYDTIKFYNNLSGSIDFASDGKKIGRIECTDKLNNRFSEDLTYYYDTIKPTLINYSLSGKKSNGVLSVVNLDGKYYSNSLTPGIFNITFDGTGSWIKDYFKINFVDSNGSILNDINSNYLTQLNLKNDSFISNLLIPISLNNIIYVYTGIPVDDKGLYEIKFNINYSDKAKNINNDLISYFYDSSNPKFEFSGDVALSPDKKTLYSANSNPLININFNTPKYRNYSCSVTAKYGDVTLANNFASTNNLNFNLKDISDILFVDSDNSIDLNFNCVDVYGEKLQGDYVLKYDNTKPILRAIFLENGNEKFYRNYENAKFSDITDSLVFDLIDTSESGYSCDYKFISTQYYSCEQSWRNINFNSFGYMNTENLFIVGGTNAKSNLSINPICVRTNKFFSDQKDSAKSNLPLNTDVVIKGVCSDMVGFKTIGKEISVNINYILSNLASLEFNYRDGKAYPIVKSFEAFKPVIISADFNGKQILVSLNNPVKGSDGMYVYNSTDGIDLNMFESGVSVIYALAIDSSGEVMDRIAKNMVVDNVNPIADIWIADENSGIVYSNEFEVFYSATDRDGQIQKVDVYLENNLIFSSDDSFKFDKNIIREPDGSLNRFSYDLKSYVGQLGFIGGGINRRYKFTIKAYDTGGNMNSSSIEVSIRDGVGITLTDSINSFVDPGKFSWVTKSISPILSFKTSKVVSSCSIYPFVDDRWIDVFRNSDKKNLNLDNGESNIDSFKFDLSSLGNYDLSSVDGKSAFVKVVCLYNRSYYNYTREVRFIDYLPDYTLISSEGFVFNEEPYSTQVDVTSVGPYRHINCEYRVDGAGYQSLSVNSGTKFSRRLDFSTLGNGEHVLNLKCSDLVGNKGPIKDYKFLINKGIGIDINNLSLSDGVRFFNSNLNNEIYVNSLDNLNLDFTLNKQNGVACSYVINPAGNFVTGVVNFFKNLLSIGVKDIKSANVFRYSVNGLNFDSDSNILKVSCEVSGMSDTIEKSYSVIYDDSSLNVSVERVAIS